jgi:hypothetical protein
MFEPSGSMKAILRSPHPPSGVMCVKMIRLPSGVQYGRVARMSFSPKCVIWVRSVPSGRMV